MKIVKILTVTAFVLSLFASSLSARYAWEQSGAHMKHGSEDSSAMHDHKNKQVRPMESTVVAHVQGMVCDFCARGLEKGFNRKREVGNTIVSLEQGTVTLQMKGDHMLSDEEITKIIEDNGMTVKSIDHGDESKREMMAKGKEKRKEHMKAKSKKKPESKEEGSEGRGFSWW